MPKHISFSINPDSLDPSNLRPPLTELDTNQCLILDSSAAITLVKHKAILHNLGPSGHNSIIIFLVLTHQFHLAKSLILFLKRLTINIFKYMLVKHHSSATTCFSQLSFVNIIFIYTKNTKALRKMVVLLLQIPPYTIC